MKENETIGIKKLLFEAISEPSYMNKVAQPSKWEDWIYGGWGVGTYRVDTWLGCLTLNNI